MKTKVAAILITMSVLSSNVAHAGYGHEGKVYTKLDLGYGIQDHDQTVTGTQVGKANDSGGGLMFNASLGHYFLDELRIDFQIHYDQGLKSKKSFISGADTVTMRGDEASFGGFVNFYYDWLNTSNVTPYVTVGAGLLRSEFTSKIAVNAANELKDKKSKYGISYKAGLGMAYHIGTNVDIDMGYSYIQKGVDKYNIAIPTAGVNVVAEPGIVHSVMVGIRLTY